VIAGAKPMMRHVTIADNVMEEVSQLRSGWKYVTADALCGRMAEAIPAPIIPDASNKKRSLGDMEKDGHDGGVEDNSSNKLNAAKLRYLQRKK